MGKASREAARERIKQERLREQKRAQRNRVLAVVGAAAVVVLLVVGVGYLVMNSGGPDSDREDLYAALPEQTVQQDGSVVVGADESAPVVEVYADFQCPACQKFEEASGPTLLEMAGEGSAVVHFRPVSIFAQRPAPLGPNSLRAAAAARAAADHGKFVEYNDILFANQPPEGQEGFSADDLKEWGTDVGIDSAEFAERVDSESEVANQYADYSQELTSAAQEDLSEEQLGSMTMSELMEWGNEQGIDSSFLDGSFVKEVLDATDAADARYEGENQFSSTPSVYINGQLVDQDTAFSPERLRAAIEDAGPGEVSSEPLASGGAESGDQDAGAPPETEE
ncbi:protein-disulfide isomerase [Lipingzhangella halophila]|uniref:Protein-disulfide isomerase n=1 Tax=Lipingzhangella halophila TaxID=1783352 RepID=A0A7W7RFI7_9ACTN|nr:thioredoxin domain-containing protein [Lipingzhangella halophila]MBB4931026.1 protein-disulfide isomerase [Lipingzhangella halophila]